MPRRTASVSRPPRPAKCTAGWREWVALPDLGVARIKAKLDTGARTSAIHAFDIETFERDGASWVRFVIHPLQRDDSEARTCEAPIVDHRRVRNSGGRAESRYFITTTLALGEEQWPIEIGLANRDEMGFRMLVGRAALKGRLIVDPGGSFKFGKHRVPPRHRKRKALT